MTAADIRDKFPGYETDLLPEAGPWYTDGFETDAMSSARAERVAAWLKSTELQDEIGDEILTLVMHGGFIDLLVKAIFGLTAESGAGEGASVTSNLGIPFPNTATGHFEIRKSRVTCHWLGRVDHLGQGQGPAISVFGGRL